MNAAELGRLFRTVRHLRPRQWIGHAGHLLRPRLIPPAWLCGGTPPPFPGVLDCMDSIPGPVVQKEFPGSSESSLLWQYNRHYLDRLWGESFEGARALFLDWRSQFRPDWKNAAWHPYPVSLRLQNLIRLFYIRWKKQTLSDADFSKALWGSVYEHANWLSHTLEYRLMVNHLFENAAALYLAGCVFEGHVSKGWKNKGLSILQRQLAEQVPADGMHVERSPMYHLRMLYVVKLLKGVCGSAELGLDEIEKRMTRALQYVVHPDGELALLNDSAFGIYPRPDEVVPGIRPWIGAWALPEAGFFGFSSGQGEYLAVDAGAPGPSYNPGHAHAGIFGFEWSVDGHRVVVDAGVADYEDNPMRKFARSTAAHSTVEINGEDQFECWGVFRVGRRAAVRGLKWEPGADGCLLSAWHDGYARIPGVPIHRRQFAVSRGMITVRDEIVAGAEVKCVSRVHLHPSCSVIHSDRIANITFPGGAILAESSGHAWEVEESWYFPGFGKREKNICLVLRAEGRKMEFCYTLARGT